MLQTLLNDEHWLKLKPILLDLNIYDKPNLRTIFTGILYRMKTGCPWRYLPDCFGKFNTVFKTFRRWSKSEKFMKIFKVSIQDPDREWVSIDGSHVRAHQSSAGSVGIESQSIAKSAGGDSTKIHLAVDAHGNPLDFLITDGVTHDIKVAPKLVSLLDLSETHLLNANKGYDSEEFRELISSRQTHPNIPRKKNSKLGNAHMDWHVYKARHVVENIFATLKHFRGIATRFDKLANSYASNLWLVLIFGLNYECSTYPNKEEINA